MPGSSRRFDSREIGWWMSAWKAEVMKAVASGSEAGVSGIDSGMLVAAGAAGTVDSPSKAGASRGDSSGLDAGVLSSRVMSMMSS